MRRSRIIEEHGAQSPRETLEFARSVTDDAHGDFSTIDHPRIMRGNAGRRLTQFKMFQSIQGRFFIRAAHDAFAGATPEERAIERR